MKNVITLSDVKKAEALSPMQITARIALASRANSSVTCSMALCIRNTPKEKRDQLQKVIYTSAKTYGSRCYDSTRRIWKEALLALHIAPIHKPRGKQTTKNPATIRENKKAAIRSAKRDTPKIVRTPEGLGVMCDAILKKARELKVFDPIELGQFSMFLKRVKGAHESRKTGKTVRTVGLTTHTA